MPPGAAGHQAVDTIGEVRPIIAPRGQFASGNGCVVNTALSKHVSAIDKVLSHLNDAVRRTGLRDAGENRPTGTFEVHRTPTGRL